MDETDFTAKIASAMSGYLGQTFDHAFVPGITLQGLSHLTTREAFCDIVKRISESIVLPLEVKIRESKDDVHYFKSFDLGQYRVYTAIYRLRVPIHYCYNNPFAVYKKASYEATLGMTNAAPPSMACNEKGVIENYENHRSLLTVIRGLCSAEGGGSSLNLLPFAAEDNPNITSSEFGFRRLMLIHNAQKQFDILSSEEIALVGKMLDKHLSIKFPDVTPLYGKPQAEIDLALKNYVTDFGQKITDAISRRRLAQPTQNDSDNGLTFR